MDQSKETHFQGKLVVHGNARLTPIARLTLAPRIEAAETRVVKLVGQGLSNSEIAHRLFVSISTVKTQVVHVYQELQVEGLPVPAIAAATRTLDD